MNKIRYWFHEQHLYIKIISMDSHPLRALFSYIKKESLYYIIYYITYHKIYSKIIILFLTCFLYKQYDEETLSYIGYIAVKNACKNRKKKRKSRNERKM